MKAYKKKSKNINIWIHKNCKKQDGKIKQMRKSISIPNNF